MVTTRPKATVRKNVGKHVDIQDSSCSECLILALVLEGARDTACLWCEQRNNLLKQVVELREELLPDQLVLLLEFLLEVKTLCPRILQCLEKTYQLREQDAEVRHRWCELVVKHKYVPGYADVKKFLREDQAMGVYLYGELMVNEDVKQQELARKCFADAQEHMDASSAKVVTEMLF